MIFALSMLLFAMTLYCYKRDIYAMLRRWED